MVLELKCNDFEKNGKSVYVRMSHTIWCWSALLQAALSSSYYLGCCGMKKFMCFLWPLMSTRPAISDSWCSQSFHLHPTRAVEWPKTRVSELSSTCVFGYVTFLGAFWRLLKGVLASWGGRLPRSKIASERRFLIAIKMDKTDSHCGIPCDAWVCGEVGCLEKGWNRQGVTLQYLAVAATLETCLEHPFTQPIANNLLHSKQQKECNSSLTIQHHCELLRRMNYCTNYCDSKQILQRHPLRNPPLPEHPRMQVRRRGGGLRAQCRWIPPRTPSGPWSGACQACKYKERAEEDSAWAKMAYTSVMWEGTHSSSVGELGGGCSPWRLSHMTLRCHKQTPKNIKFLNWCIKFQTNIAARVTKVIFKNFGYHSENPHARKCKIGTSTSHPPPPQKNNLPS